MKKHGHIIASIDARMCYVLIVLLGTLGLAGCGGVATTTVAAKGQVLSAEGTPCEGALVVFHPQEAGRINGPKPVATTDSEGRFVLTTHSENDGAEPGKYGVTVVWNQAAKESKFSLTGEGGGGADRLGGRYGDPSNPKLNAIVESGKDNDFRFEVK